MIEQILLAGNRGPCGGVNMSLEATRQVLRIVDRREPVYTNNEIVHHMPVMEELYREGLVNFRNDWSVVPDNSIVLFSAHGVSPDYHRIAEEKNCLTVDVTCQLVTRQHSLVRKAEAEGRHIIYVGVSGHPETNGVMGEVEEENITLVENIEDAKKLTVSDEKEAVLYSQTTLSTDEIIEIQKEIGKRPNVFIPARWDICYATDNRQAAVEALAPFADALLVVGSKKSHNSQELVRKGAKFGIPAYSADEAKDIDRSWFTDEIKTLGLTSGASVEERYLVDTIKWFIEENSDIRITKMFQARPENFMTFALPKKAITELEARYL
jgi:4-hydroxy-3-methylbut-2-en-1-yl diphosphate reductase